MWPQDVWILDPKAAEALEHHRTSQVVDAAPPADPQVRAAVQAASFELLVGFQLSEEQLAYNATR